MNVKVGDIVIVRCLLGEINLYKSIMPKDYRLVWSYTGATDVNADRLLWPCIVVGAAMYEGTTPFLHVITEHGVGWVNAAYVHRVLR